MADGAMFRDKWITLFAHAVHVVRLESHRAQNLVGHDAVRAEHGVVVDGHGAGRPLQRDDIAEAVGRIVGRLADITGTASRGDCRC